ncbi:MAG: hypothetical protein J6J60_04260 [Clostridia bacterium]|nr:hypothetical protein [Clostridia bacterium]
MIQMNLSRSVEEIKILFEYFFGGKYLFFIIFLASVIYMAITGKNKKIKMFFTLYIFLILFIIWNPICVSLLQKMINFSSLYRIYYMIPMQFTIAIALAKLISKIKNKKLKFECVLACCCLIIISGHLVFEESNTIEVNNWYKLPDESVEVAEIIYKDTMYEEKRAIVPYGMSSHIQQVHSSIYLPYTRIIYNPKDEDGFAAPADTDNASRHPPVLALNTGDVEFLKDYVLKHNLNYIVFLKKTELSSPVETIGFEKYQETKEHIIYRKIK